MSVAVKQLKPEVLTEPGDLKGFLLEANVMRKLKHAWVCLFFRVGCLLASRASCWRPTSWQA